MTAGKLYKIRLSDQSASSRMDVATAPSPRQVMIDALVDLDLDYEREREVLSRSSLGTTLKARLLTKLRDQYRIRRQLYIQQLTACRELT